MVSTLTTPMVIENVIQSKMRGRVIYQSHLMSTDASKLTYIKPFNDPSGKGYQRPVDSKRCKDIATYLSRGEDALFTPILMNAAGQWEFTPYDNFRPSFGRLICKGKASLMDGQHRLGGIRLYHTETQAEISIPFLAFHFLDNDEEIELFNTINTKAKGIGTSLSKYLHRHSDELSWIATEMLTRVESPFYDIGSIIGKRTNGRHITLQNLIKTLTLLTKEVDFKPNSKDEKLLVALHYYNCIRDHFPEEWSNYKGYRLTHIVCLDAFSIAGSVLLKRILSDNKNQIDYSTVNKAVNRITKIDWSVAGPLKYLKGISGSKTLASDLVKEMLPE
ncbi:DGQHR domain-containing protein [Brevibacillus panacihumi]|uniref:DGQHR domain-containing protein n=1 Tax=Brevibacillus panacihumi TaxID=497735 RepID=UPI003D00ABF1